MSAVAFSQQFGPGACPDDPYETAEAYLMRRLDPAANAAYEDHYLLCGRCAGLLVAVDQYLRAMKAAAAQLEEDRRG